MSLDDRKEKCCEDSNLKTCDNIMINTNMLESGYLTINGIDLNFTNEVPPNGKAYISTAGDQAILSFNKGTKSLFGSLHMQDGRSFFIEKCNQGHVWKEFDVSSFTDEELVLETGMFWKNL